MIGQDIFIRDLTKLATEGLLEPAFGRTAEIFAVLEILGRKRARNVLLVGYPGVGKNHLVEGIAVAGVEGETDGLLPDFRVVELDFGILAAGSHELEERLLQLIKYLRNTRDTILFVDEVHLVFEPGRLEAGTMDFRRTLAPALLRGGITSICATTPERYYAVCARNPAFKDAFEIVPIEPMTASGTYELLTKLRKTIQSHHGVEVSDEAMRAAVTLTERFLPDRYLPGKAIDVLDQACSRYRFKTAARDRNTNLVNDKTWANRKTEVSTHDVRRVVERICTPQLPELVFQERWDQRARYLRSHVFGQSSAIHDVLECLKTARDVLYDSHRPEYVFLFAGPKGVGKRFFAEHLAHALYGRREALLEFDAREFSQDALYAHFSAASQAERAQPGQDEEFGKRVVARCVLFIRGIEKAAEHAYNNIFPLLERAIVHQEGNYELNFKNCVIIFSLDVPLPQWEAIPDWDSTGGRLEAVRRQLRSSFARQLDRIVPFSPLSQTAQREILRKQVRELRAELGSFRVGIQLRQSAVDLLCSRGYNAENGAVGLVPYFLASVVDPIRKLVANRRRDSMVMVHVKARDGEIVFQSSRGRDSGPSPALTDERLPRKIGTKKSRRETRELG